MNYDLSALKYFLANTFICLLLVVYCPGQVRQELCVASMAGSRKYSCDLSPSSPTSLENFKASVKTKGKTLKKQHLYSTCSSLHSVITGQAMRIPSSNAKALIARCPGVHLFKMIDKV